MIIKKLLLGCCCCCFFSFDNVYDIQDDLDYCIEIIYEIHNGDTTQEDGLGRLEAILYMIKHYSSSKCIQE